MWDRDKLIAEAVAMGDMDAKRLGNLYDRCTEACRLPGSIIECGTGRGASTSVLAAVISERAPDKTLYLCDTFQGLPPPHYPTDNVLDWTKEKVLSVKGSAASTVDQIVSKCHYYGPRCCVETHQGLFEETLGPLGKLQFAMIHADADYYRSTWDILTTLYPGLVEGGVLVIDDYHFWTGCQMATDKYFSRKGAAPTWSTVGCAVWGKKPCTKGVL